MKFATALDCIDGRTKEPVINFVKSLGVDYVDLINYPRMDGVLAMGKKTEVSKIKSAIEISVSKHNSEFIVVAGHHDCAGNPVSKEKHIEHIEKCALKLRSWFNMKILGIYIDENWKPVKIIDLEKI